MDAILHALRYAGMSRNDGRRPDELRPVVADPSFLEQPHGMVLWSQGKTRVLCTAIVSARAFRAGSTAPAAAG